MKNYLPTVTTVFGAVIAGVLVVGLLGAALAGLYNVGPAAIFGLPSASIEQGIASLLFLFVVGAVTGSSRLAVGKD